MLAEVLDNHLITNLNPNELKILQYIYDHPHKIEVMTIREFAKEVSYSTSTILRFCRKINLSGYSELKYLIRQNHDLSTVSNQLVPAESELINELAQDVENTLLLIRENSLNQVIQEFNSSKSIHLFSGGGLTACVLDYLEKMLFSFGRQKVYRYDASTLAFHITESFNEDDILFVLSASGAYEPTLQMAHLAKMNHATVIAISPYTKNQLATIADINFRFLGSQRKNQNTEYSSRLPMYYIIQAIFTAYLKSEQGGL